MYRCLLCQKYHPFRFCNKFLKMYAEERNRVVRKHRYSINCLSKSHTFRNCESRNTCRKCKNYHHTLLHTSVKATSRSRLAIEDNRNSPDPEPATQQVMPDQRILSRGHQITCIRSLCNSKSFCNKSGPAA